jgi:hypothetical protein
MARAGSIYGDLNLPVTGSYEPKQQNRFLFIAYPPDGRLTGLPNSAIMSRARGMVGMVKSTSRPEITPSEAPVSVKFIHEEKMFAGKPKVAGTIDVVFRDGMNPVPENNLPDTMSDYNSMKFFYSWSRSVYDPYTGKMGYKLEYIGEGLLVMLDPHGVAIEEWTYKNIWPSKVTGGTVNYETAAEADCTVTFQYDKVEMGNMIGVSEYSNPPFTV